MLGNSGDGLKKVVQVCVITTESTKPRSVEDELEVWRGSKNGVLQSREGFILSEDKNKGTTKRSENQSTTEDGGPGKLYTQSTCAIRSTLVETAKAGWAQ